MTQTLANLAARLKCRARRAKADRLPALLFMTDEGRLPDPLPAIARLPPGCGVVFRHYGWPERRELGRRVAALCRARRLVLLVAADVGLAAELRADGLHLPEGLARSGAARQLSWLSRRRGLLTVAAHSRAALRRARQIGADAATLSPVFATASHPGASGLGLRRFTRLCRTSRLPVYGLGGITVKTARLLSDSGAAGLATATPPV